MTNGNRYFGVAAGVGLVVVTMSLTGAGQAVAQNVQKTVTALIVNDAANPVPVAGKVTTLTGEEPYNAEVQIAPESCGGPSCFQTFRFPKVPAGKRLIIKHVSATFSLAAGAVVFSPVFGIPGVGTSIIPSGAEPTATFPRPIQIFLTATKQMTFASYDQWTISDSVHFVVDSDQEPTLTVVTDSAHVSPFVMIATIAGAFVPVP
jgi:hypothetical protein